MSVISARDLRKSYKDVHALDGFDLSVGEGQILGLIGPNGSGKTTAINSILGLSYLDGGELDVLGLDPKRSRAKVMQQVAYIADTGILPRWIKVKDLVSYVADVHPGFDKNRAWEHLGRTDIHPTKPVNALSKGMHVQLHLALVLAIDAPLLVLDEPTLGLDIMYRSQFYDSLLNDYFNDQRSILVTTHEVREIEHILTDVVFIHRGKSVLNMATRDIAERFVKLTTASPCDVPATPLADKSTLQGHEYIFKDVPRETLASLGELSVPNLPELFIAVME